MIILMRFFCSLFFFGGLSIHLSTALLAHMFSYNMYVYCLYYFLFFFILTLAHFLGRGDQLSRKWNVQHSGSKVCRQLVTEP